MWLFDVFPPVVVIVVVVVVVAVARYRWLHMVGVVGSGILWTCILRDDCLLYVYHFSGHNLAVNLHHCKGT